MPKLDIKIQAVDGARFLSNRGEASNGWQEQKNGHGFYGRGFFSVPGDRRLMIDVQLTAGTKSKQGRSVREFPTALDMAGVGSFYAYKISGGIVNVGIKLDSVVTECERIRNQFIHEVTGLGTCAGAPLRLRIGVLLQGSREGGPEPQWQAGETGVVVGGQFESNRRKH